MRAGVIFRGLALICGDFDAENRANPVRRSRGGEFRKAARRGNDADATRPSAVGGA
jgi:hypothetical protein